MTHRSYAYEQPVPLPHNERLEFLGDAVLGVIVSDLIYRRYPDAAEGAMVPLRASVVNNQQLAALAREMDLGPHILLGRGEELSGGRDKPSVLADTLEAVIGAAYLELGMEAVAEVLVPVFAELLADAVDRGTGYPKTALQETAVKDLRRKAHLPSGAVGARSRQAVRRSGLREGRALRNREWPQQEGGRAECRP